MLAVIKYFTQCPLKLPAAEVSDTTKDASCIWPVQKNFRKKWLAPDFYTFGAIGANVNVLAAL